MNDPANDNPYAPPAAAASPAASPAVAFIQKNSLVVPVGWQSPPVCILTGKTVDLLPHRKKLLWTNPLRVVLVSGALLYEYHRSHSFQLLFLVAALLLLSIFRRKDFVNFYLNKKAAKIYLIKRIIYWILAAIFIFYLFTGFGESPRKFAIYPGWIYPACLLVLSLIHHFSFRIVNIQWRRLWLGGVPHEVMNTVVRMDEEKAAALESHFPPMRS